MNRGFYIGRFQPYHEGHHAMVERIAGGEGASSGARLVRAPDTHDELRNCARDSLPQRVVHLVVGLESAELDPELHNRVSYATTIRTA